MYVSCADFHKGELLQNDTVFVTVYVSSADLRHAERPQIDTVFVSCTIVSHMERPRTSDCT